MTTAAPLGLPGVLLSHHTLLPPEAHAGGGNRRSQKHLTHLPKTLTEVSSQEQVQPENPFQSLGPEAREISVDQ